MPLALKDFAQSLAMRGRSDNTINSYLSQLRTLDASLMIEPDADLANQLAIRIQQGRRGGDSPSTTRARLAAARAYLVFAGEDLGPLSDYKAPPLPPPSPRPLPGGMDDVRQMVYAQQGSFPMLSVVIALGGFAGLRISESLSLTWKDINFAGKRITVKGKGEKTRVIPVSDELEKILLDHRRQIVAAEAATIAPLSDSVARKRITQLAHELYIGDVVSSHDLRATFATELYKKTRNIVLVSRLLGHASIATTQAYVGFDESEAAAAVNF